MNKTNLKGGKQMKNKKIILKVGMISILGYVFYGIVAGNIAFGNYWLIPFNSAIFLGMFGCIAKYI